MNTFNSKVNIIIKREERDLNICDSYLEIDFDVTTKGLGRFAEDIIFRLFNFDLLGFFVSV